MFSVPRIELIISRTRLYDFASNGLRCPLLTTSLTSKGAPVMGLLIMSSPRTTQPSNLSATCLGCVHFSVTNVKFHGPDDFPQFRRTRTAKICSIRAFASQKSVKNFRKQREAQKNLTSQLNRSSLDESDRLAPGVDNVEDINNESSVENLDGQKSVNMPSRGAVLQACTVTSGLIAALGIVIRQVSHVASAEGWPILDCSTEVSLSFQLWHLQLITGLVILISSCRFLLLKTWPDFAESSEAANQQVLTSLQPLDYMIVAFLPGITEELLFRGALLPLFGINWKSAMLVAALFGVLHLGSGRKYSFAIWATFVGFVYGYATILSSSLVVPMASHAANNLVGGILWRYSSKLSK
ncbi:hypothetical protein Vadar_006134 [Vaccinium darrowii]|uniref:Uncharacterized protein n=1 Tax=Vaccinium darrowii TaxID=229202 RepID=A0ACB7YTE5_9ERIC|nr:hypothetical protein Vadar_006134 [Vaccinium darrowii]